MSDPEGMSTSSRSQLVCFSRMCQGDELHWVLHLFQSRFQTKLPYGHTRVHLCCGSFFVHGFSISPFRYWEFLCDLNSPINALLFPLKCCNHFFQFSLMMKNDQDGAKGDSDCLFWLIWETVFESLLWMFVIAVVFEGFGAGYTQEGLLKGYSG